MNHIITQPMQNSLYTQHSCLAYSINLVQRGDRRFIKWLSFWNPISSKRKTKKLQNTCAQRLTAECWPLWMSNQVGLHPYPLKATICEHNSLPYHSYVACMSKSAQYSFTKSILVQVWFKIVCSVNYLVAWIHGITVSKPFLLGPLPFWSVLAACQAE